MSFQVCAEDRGGRFHVLASGYATREMAEDFRVVMAKWRRVWVQAATCKRHRWVLEGAVHRCQRCPAVRPRS